MSTSARSTRLPENAEWLERTGTEHPVDLADSLANLEGLLDSLATDRLDSEEPDSALLGEASDKIAQRLLTAAVRLYAARVAAGSSIDPFTDLDAVTATDVVITVTRMLEAVEVEVFELGVWQNWGIPMKGA
jgi:hypothetical protein